MKERGVALLRDIRSLIVRAPKSPLAWILFAAFVLHVIGIGWGLPGSDAWEDDGIAPRDFLTGTYETYRPGHYFTYPPVHLLGLTVLTSPVWGLAIARAPSLSRADVIASVIQVPTMTVLTVVARLVSEMMALGIIYFLAKLAEEVWGRRAALLVAIVLTINAPLTYYAHTSNLDVPYNFWACFALLEMARAMVRREPRRLRRAILFAALAVGTKDQAYAIFLVGFPLAIAAWLFLDREVRARRGEILKHVAIGLAIAGALFLLISGAVTNPSGFRARIGFLLGPASQDHAHYAPTWAGRAEIVKAVGLMFPVFYPWPLAAAALLGVVHHVARLRKTPEKLVAGLLPMFAALSFLIAFNFTARRTEHRFSLPEMLMLGVYIGVGLDALLAFCRSEIQRRIVSIVMVVPMVWGLFQAASVDAMLILDPRYDAEAWLRANVREGDTIETYGANAYQPRFPEKARVSRVDVSPLDARNPLPDVTEQQAPFADIESRKPRFIVVPVAWSWRWFAEAPLPGHVVPPEQARRQRDEPTRIFFHGLGGPLSPYRVARESTYSSTFWPRYDIHSSTGKEVLIFERREPRIEPRTEPRTP